MLTPSIDLPPVNALVQERNIQLTRILGCAVFEGRYAVSLYVAAPFFSFIVETAYVKSAPRYGLVVLCFSYMIFRWRAAAGGRGGVILDQFSLDTENGFLCWNEIKAKKSKAENSTTAKLLACDVA